jgi:hypothetical protein
MSIDWRASLVPAAAVIPAPIAYIKVVAVKKLVVGFLPRTTGPPTGCVSWLGLGIFLENVSALDCVVRYPGLLL